MRDENTSRNVLGGELEACGQDPVTGYFRDGHCRTRKDDRGLHVVCASVTDEFLKFSLNQGNDLVTAMPAYGFPGLKDGDRWCLCATRWLEAHRAGCAPPVYLAATHERTLTVVDLDTLLPYALDLPQNG
jgi:uncharacterized protein (DUF2237 family)